MKRATLDQWEMSEMFGEPVIRGRLAGRLVTALWRYWNGRLDKPESWRIGLSWGSPGAEQVVKLGEPARDPFPLLPASFNGRTAEFDSADGGSIPSAGASGIGADDQRSVP